MITFCINTARNERYHVELLLKSLYTNLSRRDYPILVYVENDNQGTVEFLKTQKELFPNLKILINPLPIPLGYARNINLMFESAETEIVSYLQSDMVVGPLYDLEVLKFLTPDTIISATRIEPPLHPSSPEKITYDFGLDPKNFDLNKFSEFAKANKKNEMTDFWFAPFTLYKQNWLDVGGHDTLFRRSREDSDLLYRFSMLGLNMKQCWNALVYHFTCTSSRGVEWWTEKAKTRTILQQHADSIELKRFLRKWPQFKHRTTFNPEIEYKYPISVNIKNECPTDISILDYYYLFDKIYISNSDTRNRIKLEYKKLHDPANILLNISDEQWNTYKKFYRTWSENDIFIDNPIQHADIILDIDLKNAPFQDISQLNILHSLNDIIHSNKNQGTGTFIISEIDSQITINNFNNSIQNNLRVFNPSIKDIDFFYI